VSDLERKAVFDGFHAWKHAVRFGFPLTRVCTDDTEGVYTLVGQLAPDLLKHVTRVEVVDSATMREIIHDVGLRAIHHTRVIAIGKVPAPSSSLLQSSQRAALTSIPGVLVDGARHPGNLGAVVRVAAAAGAPVVVSVGELDVWHPDVVRGAAGLHAAVPVLRVGNLSEVEGPLFALDADGVDIGEFEFPAGSLLVVGAERDGVSENIRKRADGIVSLPMRQGVSSLNLATSVSAALYVHLSKIGRVVDAASPNGQVELRSP
jgi:RNA methyltransferase, TrmH family